MKSLGSNQNFCSLCSSVQGAEVESRVALDVDVVQIRPEAEQVPNQDLQIRLLAGHVQWRQMGLKSVEHCTLC